MRSRPTGHRVDRQPDPDTLAVVAQPHDRPPQHSPRSPSRPWGGPTTSLSEDLAERLLSAIIDGTSPPDTALPPEGELAEQSTVNRLTVREAVRQLRAPNVVRVVRGRGAHVNPPDLWTALEPVVRAASQLLLAHAALRAAVRGP